MSTEVKTALIQFVENILITAVIAGLFSAYPLISGEATNWKTVGAAFVSAFVYSLATSAVTYYKLKMPPTSQPAPSQDATKNVPASPTTTTP